MRNFSSNVITALTSVESPEVFILLVKAETEPPILLTSDSLNTFHKGLLFEPFPFKLKSPPVGEDQLPRATLQVDIVDQRVLQVFRLITEAPVVDFIVVLASDTEIPVLSLEGITLRSISADTSSNFLEAELLDFDIQSEPYPPRIFNGGEFPGLFQ
jgi:hypothetical protein